MIGKFTGLVPRGGIDTGILLIFLSSSLDLGNGFFKLIVHGASQDGTSNVVPEIEGSYKQDVYPWDFGYGIDP